MATVYGALGQSSPDASTLSPVYFVPNAKHATVRVVACNRSTATTVRVALAPNGEPDAIQQYIVYDLPLEANATQATAPITMGAADVIRCWSASGAVSFTVTGIEADD
jgi:hypothetical protein